MRLRTALTSINHLARGAETAISWLPAWSGTDVGARYGLLLACADPVLCRQQRHHADVGTFRPGRPQALGLRDEALPVRAYLRHNVEASEWSLAGNFEAVNKAPQR
jgi:hypothetical protein